MAEELARIAKPRAERFKGKRILYMVPLLFSSEDSPQKYMEKFKLYWKQVEEHVTNLELKIGEVKRVYHESITSGGEDGLMIMEKLNPSSYQIVKGKCQAGAELEATEDKELADECMDWERHLLMGFFSQKVAQTVVDSYTQALGKRYEHISRRIDETLKDNEAAILFIREGHMVQFSQDIEVFSVAPPALDEIHRWLRERPPKEKKRK